MVVPAMAQPKESCECMFSPKAGQWELDLKLGQGQFFNDMTGLYYLLPAADGTAMGIGLNGTDYAEFAGLGNNYISADLSTYVLNIGSLNYNSLVNIAGIQGRYFITNHIDINLMAAYNLNMQPHKDYIEGEYYGVGEINAMQLGYDASEITNKVGIGDTYASKAILGAVTHSLMAQIGADYYFNTRNPRINPFLGIFGQYKLARIQAYYPYTGQTTNYDVFDDVLQYDDIAMYRASGRAGQVMGFGGGITMGLDFSLMEGLILGFEVAPVAYQYSLMHLQVMGQDAYYAMNHNLRAFTYPQLKLGIRF